MSAHREITIVSVLPDLLSTYGDTGNAVVLRQRLRWRGIAAEILEITAGTAVPEHAEMYLLGGGQDTNQVAAARLLRTPKGLRRAVDAGACVFAVCAGLQILGTTFAGPDEIPTAGVGLLDITGRRLARRAVGELLVDPCIPGLGPVTGFENHGFGSVLGPDARPFGYVQVGVGNGSGRTEGVWADRIVGTYAHGPVLARNPALADWLLTRVTGGPLPELDLPEVDAFRSQRLVAAGSHDSPGASSPRWGT